MADRREPEPEEESVPDWVMLDKIGRTIYHQDYAAVNKDSGAGKGTVLLQTSSGAGDWGYLSFTLAEPPRPSYLDLHWRRRKGGAEEAYPYVLAADQNLLLLSIVIDDDRETHDLLVYTAASSPSLLRLPACTKRVQAGLGCGRDFLGDDLSIGILRLAADCRYYLVADLIVCSPRRHDDDDDDDDDDDTTMIATLCVYSSENGEWRDFTMTAPQPQDQSLQFPVLWSTDTVVPFDGRFLCWVDYLSGVLLCDLSNYTSSRPPPVLHFVPFPRNKHYSDDVRISRCFTDRFRSVSGSQGMIRFVHIDNHWQETATIDDHDSDYYDTDCSGPDDYETDDDDDDCCRDDTDQKSKSAPKITIWTLNKDFKWEVHREISMDCLWAQQDWVRSS